MYKKTKILLVIIFVLSTNFIVAQTLTNSPYSRYGIGELQFQGFGSSKSMGNTAIGRRSSFHINKVNPASYSAFKPNAFIMEVGIDYKLTYFETATDNQISQYTNISTLAAGFRIYKWWHTSFGLLPLSGVGYNISSKDTLSVDGESTVFTNNYTGKGGLNEIYFGNSFTVFNKFSLGINTSYVFGSIEKNTVASIIEINSTTSSVLPNFASNAYYYDRTTIRGLQYKLGFQYTDSIKSSNDKSKNKLIFTIGATFENTSKLQAYNTLLLIRHTSSLVNRQDTISNSTLITDGNVLLPRSFGFGASVKIYDKLTVSADYYTQNWQTNSFLNKEQPLTSSSFMGFGMEYCNNSLSTIYRKTIRYRTGGYYSNSYVKLNNAQINDYGITFGVGFPLKTTLMNTSFQLGTRGSIDNNMLKESYVLFNLNFSLYDTWFVKRKFF